MSNPRHNDYQSKMPHLDFKYDAEYYPDDAHLPDPQTEPLIFGARVQLNKVGVNGVDLPIKFLRRDGTTEQLYVQASLYGSLDNVDAKGLNLSRFPIIMHQLISPQMIEVDAAPEGEKFSLGVLRDLLKTMAQKQGSSHSNAKFRFKYPWVQDALRTRKEFVKKPANEDEIFQWAEDKMLSYEKAQGYIFYTCELEGQLHDGEYKFFLTVDYIYSSTCPCSFELAQDATVARGQAANGHSQRSIAKIKVEFNPDNHIVWIEDIVELARKYVPTEVIVICKRRDEQAFAELNGSNLLFTEDAARLLYAGLDELYDAGKISDFAVVTEHLESLHPWSATAVVYKGVPNGLR